MFVIKFCSSDVFFQFNRQPNSPLFNERTNHLETELSPHSVSMYHQWYECGNICINYEDAVDQLHVALTYQDNDYTKYLMTQHITYVDEVKLMFANQRCVEFIMLNSPLKLGLLYAYTKDFIIMYQKLHGDSHKIPIDCHTYIRVKKKNKKVNCVVWRDTYKGRQILIDCVM
jgi:hypothetical protein